MPEQDDQHDEQSGSALRKQLEAALAENAELKQQARVSAISKALDDKGFDPGATALVAAQVKDPGELDSWLEANGKFLAKKAAPPAEEEPPADPPPPPVSDEQRKALQQVVNHGPSDGQPSPSDFEAELARVNTREELDALLQRYGRKPRG